MEPKTNTTYQCKRTDMIRLEESPGGALMCKIPYESLDEDPIAGTYSCCVGAKDGTMQELTINNLMTVFKVNDLIELPTLPLVEGHEFDLSDWEPKEKYPAFKWLNAPRAPQDQSAIQSKWGAKLALFSKKPAQPLTPTRVLPVKKKARIETGESVMALLAKKHGKDESDAEAMQELGITYFFPAQDELFGEGVEAKTSADWVKVAEKLGL